MRTVILKTISPLIISMMFVFSIFILLRGHNTPGGGFIGGLIAASAIAVSGIAVGVETARKALVFKPLYIASFGLMLASGSGFISIFYGASLFTGIWKKVSILGFEITIATPILFDIGVWLIILGVLSNIVLAFEDTDI